MTSARLYPGPSRLTMAALWVGTVIAAGGVTLLVLTWVYGGAP